MNDKYPPLPEPFYYRGDFGAVLVDCYNDEQMRAYADAATYALRAQLAEAQRDSERLDWMIEQCAYVVSDPDCCDGYWLRYQRPAGTVWVQATEHATPRAAIDAAISTKGEPSCQR